MKLDKITAEPWNFIIDHGEKLEQGVHLWYKGVPFPRRVYYDPLNDPNFTLRVLEALGTVKKFLFALVHLKSLVIPRTLDIQKYEIFLSYLQRQIDWVLGDYYIKDSEYSVPVFEMGKFIRVFLQNLGFSEGLSKDYARVGMMVLEFDNAYRHRPQDLAGETTKELLLANPRQEINRLVEIYLSRELEHQDIADFGARDKIVKVAKLLSYALLIPKVKKAFKAAVEAVDLGKIRFDENDRFHVSFWHGYDFEGKSFEERFTPHEELYKTIPFIRRKDPKVTADFLTGN